MPGLVESVKAGLERLHASIQPRLNRIKKKQDDKQSLTASETAYLDDEGNIVDEQLVADILERASNPEHVLAGMSDKHKGLVARLRDLAKEVVDIASTVVDAAAEPLSRKRHHTNGTDGKKKKGATVKNPRNTLMHEVITLSEHQTKLGKNSTRWGCIANECQHTEAGRPGQGRVFLHAQSCAKLRSLHPKLYERVLEWQASQHSAKDNKAEVDNDSDNASVVVVDEPPAKKQKTDSLLNAWARTGHEENRATSRKAMQEKVDQAIVQFICCCGIPPNALDSDEWRAVCRALNPEYHPTSGTKFTTTLIPQAAAAVRVKTRELLRKSSNITVSFDGNNTRRDSLYLIHASIPVRDTKNRRPTFHRSLLLDGHEGTLDSHTADWIVNKLKLSIEGVGWDRVTAIVSDNASNCAAARTQITDAHPTCQNLRDPCHDLHLNVKSITVLDYFDFMVSLIKPILTHFSKSPHSRGLLRASAGEDGVQTLQKIGKTRFGSHYMAVCSIFGALEQIHTLCVDGKVTFKNDRVQQLFSTWCASAAYHDLHCRLQQYQEIIQPFMRAIWALESSALTVADVFAHYTAIAGMLRELLLGDKNLGLPRDVTRKIIDSFNDRFDRFFNNDHDIYFAGFALDITYPIADVFLISEAADGFITVPRHGTDLSHQHPRARNRVLGFLKGYLGKILDRKAEIASLVDGSLERNSAYMIPLFERLTEEEIISGLISQFDQFWKRQHPFTEPAKHGVAAWWAQLITHPQANVLATIALRILEILPNSMPDERTGSTFTWMNSPLRGSQKVDTLVNMILVRQWHRFNPHTDVTRPTVKYRDMEKKLVERLQTSRSTRYGTSDNIFEDNSEDEDVHDPKDSDDTGGELPRLLPNNDCINIRSNAILDLLSTKPLSVPTTEPIAPTKATSTSTNARTLLDAWR